MHENKSGMDRSKIIDTLKQRGGFITTGEVKSRGEYEQLRRAIEDGTLIRIRNGVYVEMSALANNMIDVERIVPHGVLCLYSAFAHYGLSMQVPSATCHGGIVFPRCCMVSLFWSACVGQSGCFVLIRMGTASLVR